MTTPLRNLKCLDLSRQLPGPFCSMMLADLGVDVLVVASPKDPMGLGLPIVQRNKRHMTLNMKDPRGRELFEKLLADADIVLEGFRPGVTTRLGIDYDAVAKINPRVVYCSISGYGQDGPYRDKVGHDLNYLGYSGILGVTGPAGGAPQVMPVQVADIGGGALMGVVGILAALAAREHTGRGQFVDISMMDGSVIWNAFHQLMLLATGKDPERGRTQLTGHNPCYAVYETKDGKHVTVGALEPHFWANLCNHLGVPELIADQFAEGARREEMFAILREKFLQKTRDEWVTELEPIDICFGPVNTVSESLADPQIVARGLVHKVNGLTLVGSPIKLSDTPAAAPSAPPKFGEHTDETLRGLGIEQSAIDALRADGVI
jgi:crotonobetainyl-CoA:carnitine CoA-transferase CaiB-like acyl-CoA transferase